MASLYFPQYENELFYKYFNRVSEYVSRCRYPYQTWELCHVIYNGLNEETAGHVDSLSEGRFIDYFSYEEKWELFQYLAYDTEQWELENSHSRRPQPRASETLNSQSSPSMSTEEMICALATNLSSFQQETRDSIQNLLSQATQVAEAIARLEAHDESNLHSREFKVGYDSELDEPYSQNTDESHSIKECDVGNNDDDDDDGFWDEDGDYGSNFYAPSKTTCIPETPTVIQEETPNIGDYSLLNNSVFDDSVSVVLENMQEEVIFVTCEVENNRLDDLNDVRDKLLLDRDLRKHTLPFEVSMITPLEKEGMSLDFREDKIIKDGEEDRNFVELKFTKEPLVPLLQGPYDLVSQRLHLSPYMIVLMSNLTCKDEYIDTGSFFEYSGTKTNWLYAFTSIIYGWYQLVCTSYHHFSNMCASIFDRLLRALSCSSLELTNG
ncbi:hypothetical protein RND81_08G101000 [Saponaria officinalis]|uniref:Uncharacterized protein n=1 Tax=Saponaria officinalis TaxID=3572 RepID=A0AAW1J6G9_SAPOF